MKHEEGEDDMRPAAIARDIMRERFPTQHRFSLMIEELSAKLNVGYVEAVVHYCEKNDIEIETAAKLINPTMRDKLKKEFSEKLGMLPKVPKLKRK